jgi:hypothetical protein
MDKMGVFLNVSENMLNWCMHMKMSVVNDFVLHTAPVRLLSPFFSIGNFSSRKRNILITLDQFCVVVF